MFVFFRFFYMGFGIKTINFNPKDEEKCFGEDDLPEDPGEEDPKEEDPGEEDLGEDLPPVYRAAKNFSVKLSKKPFNF